MVEPLSPDTQADLESIRFGKPGTEFVGEANIRLERLEGAVRLLGDAVASLGRRTEAGTTKLHMRVNQLEKALNDSRQEATPQA